MGAGVWVLGLVPPPWLCGLRTLTARSEGHSKDWVLQGLYFLLQLPLAPSAPATLAPCTKTLTQNTLTHSHILTL